MRGGLGHSSNRGGNVGTALENGGTVGTRLLGGRLWRGGGAVIGAATVGLLLLLLLLIALAKELGVVGWGERLRVRLLEGAIGVAKEQLVHVAARVLRETVVSYHDQSHLAPTQDGQLHGLLHQSVLALVERGKAGAFVGDAFYLDLVASHGGGGGNKLAGGGARIQS